MASMLWVFIKGGCSGSGVQWIGVVLCNKLVYNIIQFTTPCFHCTPLWCILRLAGSKHTLKRRAPMGRSNWFDSYRHARNTYTLNIQIHTKDLARGTCSSVRVLVSACLVPSEDWSRMSQNVMTRQVWLRIYSSTLKYQKDAVTVASSLGFLAQRWNEHPQPCSKSPNNETRNSECVRVCQK